MSWSWSSPVYDGRYMSLTITEVVNKGSNSSTLKWTLKSAGGNYLQYAVADTVIKIDGETVYHNKAMGWNNNVFPVTKGSKSGEIVVFHDPDGTRSAVPISFKTNIYYGNAVECAGDSISLTSIQTYNLSILEQTGCNISVNRIASGYADPGEVTSGQRLYYNDKLTIEFVPDAKYTIKSGTVNGNEFVSGGTHTVVGDVSITATAEMLSSQIRATDANVGSVSTITITKFNPKYYHSILYQFRGETGYITRTGEVVSSPVKYRDTSIPFTIPTSFYSKMVDTKSDICTLHCTTYTSETAKLPLGVTSVASIKVTATGAPAVVGSVVDINQTTKNLTGDQMKFIRYKSTARAMIQAGATNSAVIAEKYINGTKVNSDFLDFPGITYDEFVFSAVDSRGYKTTAVQKVDIIPYKMVTINASAQRLSPTSTIVSVNVDGDYYNGSFGSAQNSLTLKYRYREKGAGTFSNWKALPGSVLIAEDKYTSGNINLPDLFDYQKSYVLELSASDGTVDNVLSTATRSISIQEGIPIFDWGKSDFNLHVPLKINGVNVFDLIYPVGSIYMSLSPVNPGTIFGGTWERWGKGKTIVGLDENDSSFQGAGQSGGAKSVTLQKKNLPQVKGTLNFRTLQSTSGSTTNIVSAADNGCFDFTSHNGEQWSNAIEGVRATNIKTDTVTFNNGGASEPVSVLQPYVVCYMWVRSS